MLRRFIAYGPSLTVLAAVLATLLLGPAAVRRLSAAKIEAVVTLAQQRLDEDDLLERLNQATRDIAAAVEPSVVFIRAVIPGRFNTVGQSTGSGWVYDDLGHIVTNNHVIAGASEVRVQFYDGRVRKASLVGVDPSTDIALLRVGDAPDTLFPARRATGLPVHQGDRVFAFGSPFGLKFSMSGGIVSGLGRNAATGPDSGSRYSNFIQTDAAINPGNSGGPLVDVNGRVIGMNTAIITSEERAAQGGEVTGISGGIGFAIPLETIESVVTQLIERGVVFKGYLGVSLSELDVSLAERLGYPYGWGVVVGSVQEGQPAERAGIQPGDIIFEIDGRPTRTVEVLRSIVSNQSPGKKVHVRFWRDGQVHEVEVTLAAARVDASGQLRVVDPFGDVEAALAREKQLTELVQNIARYGLTAWEPRKRGVLILAVRPGSEAAGAGFRPGQLIIGVDDKPVVTLEQLLDALLHKASDPAARGEELTVFLDVINPAGRTYKLPLRLQR
ncbi:MAG: PDZ domain-containing protein [Planctomycetota bacterium]|nr:MAG: PDZ domain-containing protein [Planctomycetota bacterium]